MVRLSSRSARATRSIAVFADLEGRGNRRWHQLRVAHWRQINEPGAVAELFGNLICNFNSQPRLASARGTDQRQETYFLAPQSVSNPCHVVSTTDQHTGLRRESELESELELEKA